MRIAALDLGTNTFQLLIADKDNDSVKVKESRVVITGLGNNYDRNSAKIDSLSIDRSINQLRIYSDLIKQYKVDKVKAVATSVVRDANNGQEFVEKAYQYSGIKIDIISGIEEAKLASYGVLNSINSKTDLNLIVDIGGGSTEFSLLNNNELKFSKSLPLGVTHLFEEFFKSELPTNDELSDLDDNVFQLLNQRLKRISEIENDSFTLVANSGTAITLASVISKIEKYVPELVNGQIVELEELKNFLNIITKLTPEKRIEKFSSIERGREDLLIPGLIILKNIINLYNKSDFVVSSGGVKEGLVYECT